MKERACVILIAICLPALMRCADMMGAGSETTNSLTGIVLSSNGLAAPATVVRLLPSDYDCLQDSPLPPSRIDTTDSLGRYHFSRIGRGAYSIEAVALGDRKRASIFNVQVGTDSVAAPAATLRPAGAVRMARPEGFDPLKGYIYIPGTTISAALVDGEDSLTLDSVPAGMIPSVNYNAVIAGALPRTIRDSVLVIPGATTIIGPQTAFYAQKLYLNTTASGANVLGSVGNFPVLMRLNAGNFDFAKARQDGADLRFAKSDGTVLPFEIEEWNGAARTAVVWVTVDTLHGNDSAQHIEMRWGNASAIGGSDGNSVFRIANGFQGVWHLDESAGAALDATGNHFDGAFKGTLPKSNQGLIGQSQSFDGKSDCINFGNVLNMGTGDFTISTWVKRSRTRASEVLIGKSGGGGPSASYGYSFAFFPDTAFNFAAASGGAVFGDTATFQMATNQTVTDTVRWHYIVAVVKRSSNGECALYIDGNKVATAYVGNILGVQNCINNLDFLMGIQGNGYLPFKGMIDETVVAGSARSADWVRLCFMNQRLPDALVRFEQ
jgi:hypothetical protein